VRSEEMEARDMREKWRRAKRREIPIDAVGNTE
jgi:hypothetical protein